MKSKSFRGMACSIAGALEAIGDRWAFLVLRDLSLGLRRYDELQASSGIPTTTLAQRLKHLEKHGLVERTRYQDHPPRYEYRLTPRGADLRLTLIALAQWGDRWDASGRGAPPVQFVDQETGRPLTLALVDARAATPRAPGSVAARPGRGADDLVRWRLARRDERQREESTNGAARAVTHTPRRRRQSRDTTSKAPATASRSSAQATAKSGTPSARTARVRAK